MGWKVSIRAQPDDYSCGPVTLQALMCFYGVEVPLHDLRVACGCNEYFGTSHVGMVAAAEQFDFRVEVRTETTIVELRRLVDESPVIVGWTIGGIAHYSIVRSISHCRVNMADCDHELKHPRRSMLVEQFIKNWHDTNTIDWISHRVTGWCMIIQPK